MISVCHTAGVKIIAGEYENYHVDVSSCRHILTLNFSSLIDTLFNHMTAQSSGTGVAGSSFTYFDYPGTYGTQDFHYCDLEPNNVIVDYSNRLEVQTCELDGLAE